MTAAFMSPRPQFGGLSTLEASSNAWLFQRESSDPTPGLRRCVRSVRSSRGWGFARWARRGPLDQPSRPLPTPSAGSGGAAGPPSGCVPRRSSTVGGGALSPGRFRPTPGSATSPGLAA